MRGREKQSKAKQSKAKQSKAKQSKASELSMVGDLLQRAAALLHASQAHYTQH